MPYFAWRSSKKPCKDQRHNRKQEPLRRCRDISLLNFESGEAPAFIYEAQTSCVVAGTDEWDWSGYCLADTYFDGEAGENVQQYSKDVSDGAHTNPFFYGLIEAERPVREARAFFLRVFKIRLNVVRGEWQRVITNIKDSVSKYEEVSFLLAFFQRDQITRRDPSSQLHIAYVRDLFASTGLNISHSSAIICYFGPLRVETRNMTKKRLKRSGDHLIGSMPS